jgi:histidyl-tRNA synthetase
MKDILPSDQPYWRRINELVESFAERYRYERIDTPILEETWLFTRSVGKETDIVEKEMYQFLDRSGDNISLRPEATAGIVRAYIEHGFVNQPQPVKLFTSGPFFRYDRPQAGRYRELHQFDFEAIGDPHPIVDAQLIAIASRLLGELGIPVQAHINSIGDAVCRPVYVKALTDYYRSRKNALCEACKKRLQRNPLRILDCKEPDCKNLATDAPQTVDHLCDPCRTHFVSVLEYLDEQEVPYTLNPKIVRGLDYYTRTTFELFATDGDADASQSALGGGGRFDGLIEQLGGRPTPAVGFACGIERIVNKLRVEGEEAPRGPKPDIFLGQLGDPARKLCIKLFDALQREGVRVAESLSKDGIKTQLEAADRLGATFTLIIGQKEIMDGTVLIRDMENGIQEVVDYQKAVPEILKRLNRGRTSDHTEVPPTPRVPEESNDHGTQLRVL